MIVFLCSQPSRELLETVDGGLEIAAREIRQFVPDGEIPDRDGKQPGFGGVAKNIASQGEHRWRIGGVSHDL